MAIFAVGLIALFVAASWLVFILIATLLFGSVVNAASAQSDLCLVLLQDTSSSLDTAEFETMRTGLAGTLIDSRLASAFGAARVQVMVVTFGGVSSQSIVVDWFTANTETLRSAAATITGMEREPDGTTATGEAINFAMEQLDRVSCSSEVIDIATDGESNSGRSPASITAEIDSNAVQINGLVVGKPEDVARFQALTQFGFGAFTVHAEDYDDFGKAMMRKLSREISMNTVRRAEG
jgi:hypothetical protein